MSASDAPVVDPFGSTLAAARHHHRLVHHGDWQITVAADRHPTVIPPPWIDPQQKPLRNTYFKPKPQP